MAIINFNSISGVSTISVASSITVGNVAITSTTITAPTFVGNVNSTSGVTTVTTLNTTTITGVSTAGITTAYIGSINNGPISGSKNRLINGDFEIWQRGTSVTYLGGSASTMYLADRWSGGPEYQNARHQRVSVTSPIAGMTARYALRASSSTSGEAASGTRIALGQKIENVNCYDLAGKQVTLSFYVKFSSATASASSGTYGNWGYYLAYDGTTTDGNFNTTSPPTSTFYGTLIDGSLPTTWTKYTLTATVPSGTNNISARFQFDNLKNTTSADTMYYDITNIQLEEGPVATAFERRSYGQELALCQRYYYSATSQGYWFFPPTTSDPNGKCNVMFKQTMRATPTTYAATRSTSGSATISFDNITVDGAAIALQSWGNAAAQLQSLTASAEL